MDFERLGNTWPDWNEASTGFNGRADSHERLREIYGPGAAEEVERGPHFIDNDAAIAESNNRLADGWLTLFADIEINLGEGMLVDQILPKTGVGMLFGPSGITKTFVTLDLGLAVARGIPFAQKYDTVPGHALMAAIEAPEGVRRRLVAYRQYNKITSIPFGLIAHELDLCDAASVSGFIEKLRSYRQLQGSNIALLIIDTLNRAMPGRDENGPKDASAAVASLQRIQQATGGFVLVVHHPGKDQARGARGHSSIMAAMDAVLEVEGEKKNPVRHVRLTKLKDGPDNKLLGSYRLERVILGTDHKDREVTSAVISWCEACSAAPRFRLSPAQAALLNHFDQIVRNGNFIKFEDQDGLPNGLPCVRVDDLVDRAIKGRDVANTDKERNARTSIKSQIQKMCRQNIVHQFDGFVWRIRT